MTNDKKHPTYTFAMTGGDGFRNYVLLEAYEELAYAYEDIKTQLACVLVNNGKLQTELAEWPNNALQNSLNAEREKSAKLVEALERIHHALANAQEWHISDPEDSEMDRDAQLGNWIEKGFDEIKTSLSEYESQKSGNSDTSTEHVVDGDSPVESTKFDDHTAELQATEVYGEGGWLSDKGIAFVDGARWMFNKIYPTIKSGDEE